MSDFRITVTTEKSHEEHLAWLMVLDAIEIDTDPYAEAVKRRNDFKDDVAHDQEVLIASGVDIKAAIRLFNEDDFVRSLREEAA